MQLCFMLSVFNKYFDAVQNSTASYPLCVLGHECDMWKVSCDMCVTFITERN